MASVMQWLRSLGNDGASTNARLACEERRRTHAELEVTIARLSPKAAVATPTRDRVSA